MMITRFPLALLVVSAVSLDTATAVNMLRMTPRHLQTYTQYGDYYQEMLDAVNAERSKAGLAALCTNNKLSAAAERHAEDMAANNFMSHQGSDGSTMSQRITDSGYEWDAVAENVAAGQKDVTSVMKSWMNSKGHRANILGADYTMMGMAYAYNGGSTYKHYWAQDFGAGETEACDGGNATDSMTTGKTQEQTQDDRAASATKSRKTSYTMGPSPTTMASTTPSATVVPSIFTPSVIASAPIVQSPVVTETPAAITQKIRGCKAKK